MFIHCGGVHSLDSSPYFGWNKYCHMTRLVPWRVVVHSIGINIYLNIHLKSLIIIIINIKVYSGKWAWSFVFGVSFLNCKNIGVTWKDWSTAPIPTCSRVSKNLHFSTFIVLKIVFARSMRVMRFSLCLTRGTGEASLFGRWAYVVCRRRRLRGLAPLAPVAVAAAAPSAKLGYAARGWLTKPASKKNKTFWWDGHWDKVVAVV